MNKKESKWDKFDNYLVDKNGGEKTQIKKSLARKSYAELFLIVARMQPVYVGELIKLSNKNSTTVKHFVKFVREHELVVTIHPPSQNPGDHLDDVEKKIINSVRSKYGEATKDLPPALKENCRRKMRFYFLNEEGKKWIDYCFEVLGL